MGQSVQSSIMDLETKKVMAAIQADVANLHAFLAAQQPDAKAKAAKTGDVKEAKLADELQSAP